MMYQVIRRLRRSLPKSLGCQRRVDCFAHAGNLFRIGRSKEREDSVWRGAVEKAATERQRRDLGLFVCSLLCAYLFDTFFKSGAVKIFRHLARKMKDGKEELVGRTGLSWSFSYLLLKFQVLVPRVSTLISRSSSFVLRSPISLRPDQ